MTPPSFSVTIRTGHLSQSHIVLYGRLYQVAAAQVLNGSTPKFYHITIHKLSQHRKNSHKTAKTINSPRKEHNCHPYPFLSASTTSNVSKDDNPRPTPRPYSVPQPSSNLS